MGDVVGEPTLQAPVAVGDVPPGAAATPASAPHRARWRFWRSPPDQPAWARPALLLVAALAALSYSWGSNTVILETFYAAAARSMSQSWHNFFFGAFDPWGTVSVDKLPGAFWVQGLSLRLFGFHTWAIALPQAVEGTLTVLVLYRVVRRVAGAGAGLTAAVVLAATPVTVLLNRANVSDTLLILLLVLAADAATRAFLTGRLASLLLAGVWVGLAFQAKMLQAWLVLPALFLTYLLAAPIASLGRRMGHLALATVVVLVVSVSWMSVVTLVPAQDRPYADGSCNNSVYSQVFLYNGADRITGKVLDQPGCSPPTAAATSAFTAHTVPLSRGPGRFLSGPFGLDAAWMLLPAVVSLAGILFVRRRQPRTDPLRAAAVLWLLWLFFTWTFFADAKFLNAYYLAALAPPMAALCGMGLSLAWHARPPSRAVTMTVMATVIGGVAFALDLLPSAVGVRPWIIATTIAATAAAVGLLALSLRAAPPTRSPPRRTGPLRRRAAARPGLGLRHGRVVRVERVRQRVPVGGLHGPGARGQCARRHVARPQRRCGAGPGPHERPHRGVVGRGCARRARHRTRIPAGRGLHRPGPQRDRRPASRPTSAPAGWDTCSWRPDHRRAIPACSGWSPTARPGSASPATGASRRLYRCTPADAGG